MALGILLQTGRKLGLLLNPEQLACTQAKSC